jgi:cation-transporting ATPase 13A1
MSSNVPTGATSIQVVPHVPDNGYTPYVLRTGYSLSQGKLMGLMALPSGKVTGSSLSRLPLLPLSRN